MNGTDRLTNAELDELRALLKGLREAGWSQTRIAKSAGVSQAFVSGVLRGAYGATVSFLDSIRKIAGTGTSAPPSSPMLTGRPDEPRELGWVRFVDHVPTDLRGDVPDFRAFVDSMGHRFTGSFSEWEQLFVEAWGRWRESRRRAAVGDMSPVVPRGATRLDD